MFFNRGFDNVRKVLLLTLLMAQPVFVQAQASEDVAGVTAVKQGASNEPAQRSYYLPRWPEQRKQQKHVLPPPPPGPYMSTALTGSSAKWLSFASVNPGLRMQPPASPKEAFSPDIPWPSNASSPDRWQPENGYSYVKPPVKQSYSALSYNRPTNYSYRAPTMNGPGNWPGFNGSAMPLRGSSARMYPGGRDTVVRKRATRANVYAPPRRPQNNNYGRRPSVNNAAMPPRQSVNRAP